MILAVVVLGALVWLLARNAPADPNQTPTGLAPDNTIPATGITGVPSPATAGGTPGGANISSSNQLRQSMYYENVVDDQKVYSSLTPTAAWKSRQRGSTGDPNYLTDAESSLRTQDVRPTTANLNRDVGGIKL